MTDKSCCLFRSVDGGPCAYKRCEGGASILPSDEAVIVTTPTKQLKRLAAKSYLKTEFTWTEKPQTCFHRVCWDKIMIAEMPPSCRRVIDAVAGAVELFDTAEIIQEKAKQLASLLKASTKTVVFTGAGISASSGISTYRGTDGIDTLAELGGTACMPSDSDLYDEDGNLRYEKLQPTVAHKTLVELEAKGLLSYVITQNCDDLHAKAGFPRGKLSELHGNVFVEYCDTCNTEYVRDYAVDAYSTSCTKESWYVMCPACKFNHFTGRRCRRKGCKGKLKDTIVNFGDDLHSAVLGGFPRAEKECKEADLVIVVGSSMSVTPASDLPRMARQFVVVNLQDLEDHSGCTFQVHASSDLFFEALRRYV